jgi:hypothetical protein
LRTTNAILDEIAEWSGSPGSIQIADLLMNWAHFLRLQFGNAVKNRAIRSNSSAPSPDACGISKNNRASGYYYPLRGSVSRTGSSVGKSRSFISAGK